MTRRTLAVVTAGISQPSATRLLADRLGAATKRALEDQGTAADIEVVELRDHAHDLVNAMLTGFPSGGLSQAITDVLEADALIAVTPIFTASYSGLFKAFFDVLEAGSLAGKPVLIAATGGTGRHSLALEHALRPLFAYLRSVVVPTAVYAASSDWGRSDTKGGALTQRIDPAARELASLTNASTSSGPRDLFDDPTPFEQLLAGG